MGKLHEIRLRSNRFVANMNVNIDQSIIHVEHLLLDLNRDQMKNKQIDSRGNFLPEYSSRWKSIKGLTYFNLFDTGDFQKKLFMNIKTPLFLISSSDWKLLKLLKRVGERMFGIAPTNQNRAKQLTGKSFARLYRREVLRK